MRSYIAVVALLAVSAFAQTPLSLSNDDQYTPGPAQSYTPAAPAADESTVAQEIDFSGNEAETPAPILETPAPIEGETPAPLTEETPAAADPEYYHHHRHRRQAANATEQEKTTKPGTNATQEGVNATCTAAAVCYQDADCGSTGDKKGRCIGVFNGKCNCNACLNFLTCKDDSACGGLKGACNSTTSRCSCEEGYKANGFAGGFLDAFRELCNVKDCNKDNEEDACFGLPCHSGLCVC